MTDIIVESQTYKRRKSLLIAVDFDGTIVDHAFPEVGKPLPGAIETLREIVDAGHHIILYTCREDGPVRGYLSEATRLLERHGVTIRSVNCNHPEDEFRSEIGRKPYADIYIDDRNLGGFPGWDCVRAVILEQS